MKKQGITISNFLEWVKEVHYVEVPLENLSMYQNHVYFRGHASTSWEILPSLFRDKGRIHDEHLMLEMASNMLWTELNDCNSELDKMIRLQHYGLHTRLLDVTYNPLVALFFACQDHDDNDGLVICGYKEKGSNLVCQAIAEYVFKYDVFNIKELAKICEQKNVKEEELKTIHFVSPPLNNPRISIQNGAFIMSPLLNRNLDKHFNIASYAYIKKEMEAAFEKQFVIPKDSKPTIIKELDYLGFNKATIYTDISNKLKYINEKEDNDECQNVDLS